MTAKWREMISLLILCFLVVGSHSHIQAQEPTQEEEITQWIARLSEGKPGDNNAATEALIKIGQPAILYLLDVLESDPSDTQDRALLDVHWTRLRAAHCLSMLNYPDVVNLLGGEIRRDSHPTMRLIYAIYLIRHDIQKAIEALVADLKRAEFTVPDIIITLKNINNRQAIPVLEPLLKDPRLEIQLAAAEVLVSLGSESGEQILLSQIENPDVQLRAALILPLKYRDTLLPILKKSLDHTPPQTRLKIAERLADMGQPDGFEILLDALQNESEPWQRGSDMLLHEVPRISDRVFALIGRPDTYDPFGTQRHRDAIINRWRRSFSTQGREFLQGLSPQQPSKGQQTLDFDGITITKPMDDMKTLFYLSGRKLYEIGAMDGSFPPVGRLLGDEGGIWAHPIKLMDGFQYTITEDAHQPWTLNNCHDFVHQFASCTFHFAQNNLQVIRHDYIAEEARALFSKLTIKNLTNQPRQLTIEFSGLINIRPSWRSGLENDLDILEYRDGYIIASDNAMPEWSVLFGGDRPPEFHKLHGNEGVLSYPIQLSENGEAELVFLIFAAHRSSIEEAQSQFQSLFSQSDGLLAQKEASYRERILSGVQFQCDDPSLTQAFLCAKANLVMMSADLRPYSVAPYLLTGIPLYARLFGNDVSYSIPGATAGGFREMARGSLESLAHYTEQQSGRVPHEVSSSGKNIISPGNTQEMPQFVMACGSYVQWTGDLVFLRKIYPLCKQSIFDMLLKRFDADGDDYPEGPGMVELTGMGPEKIDSACYLYNAFQTLGQMAEILQLPEEAKGYRHRAAKLKARFNSDWWSDEAGMWADSLNADGSQRLDGHWTVAVPMETEIASADRADQALDLLEKEWINKWGFVHTRKQDISTDNPFVFLNSLLAIAAFNYGRTDLGFRMLQLAARSPLEFEMLGGFDEAIPKSADFMQLWSSARFLEAVIQGLVGVRPQAYSHRVNLFVQLPIDLNHFALRNLAVGEHQLTITMRRELNREIMRLTHHSGPSGLECFIVPHRDWKKATLDGEAISAKEEVFGDKRILCIPCKIPPGVTQTLEFYR